LFPPSTIPSTNPKFITIADGVFITSPPGRRPLVNEERKYRVAVVGGAGVWGARYLQGYSMHPRSEIVALVDTNRERRREFADHYGIKQDYDTVDDLLAEDVPDIVSASVPVGVAHNVVIACAEAGVRVVSCEKPLSDELSKADHMVSVCRERGVPFGCGTAMWEVHNLEEVCGWIREGNIGELTEASILSGLIGQVSGTGCVPLNFLRFITGMEVEWVEGWTDPEESAGTNEDCSAYGLLGLSGGITCKIPPPSVAAPVQGNTVSLIGTDGRVWLSRGKAILVRGTGVDALPITPEFMTPIPEGKSNKFFKGRIESLMRSCETGCDPPASGDDYRRVLEIAVALKLSAREGHRRIHLPLADRNHVLRPRPWRLLGGDIAGWDEVGRTPRIVD
jgi:predicted dehydrogenase